MAELLCTVSDEVTVTYMIRQVNRIPVGDATVLHSCRRTADCSVAKPVLSLHAPACMSG